MYVRVYEVPDASKSAKKDPSVYFFPAKVPKSGACVPKCSWLTLNLVIGEDAKKNLKKTLKNPLPLD